MTSHLNGGAAAMPRVLARSAMAAAALFSVATCIAAAAPAPKAPPVVMAAPRAPQTGTFNAPPIMPVDAPQNKLHLTADQQNKANAIMGGFFQKRNAIVANKNQTQAQMQAAYVALSKSTHDQMLTILTPAQKTQLTQIQANRTQYAAGAQAAQQKAAHYSQQLRSSFTPTQKTKIDTIEKSAVSQLRGLSMNPKLTIQQKQQQGIALQNGVQTKIKALLTPTQLTIYANLQRYADQFTTLRRLAQESGV